MLCARRVSVLLLAGLLAIPLAAAQKGADPTDPRSFTWVEPGVIAIGGGGLTEADVQWLHEQGFGAIADFRGEHDDPADAIRARGMAFLDMPIDHAPQINLTQVLAFLDWARVQEEAGRPIYIHCTNGWHRAATFAVAWEMARDGRSLDDLEEAARERRPGTMLRAPGVLLQLQAQLRHEPPLAVRLLSDVSRPDPNGTLPVVVEVLAGGKPAVGAEVRAWTEAEGLDVRGVTDEQGRFAFVFRAPPGRFMDHLYARASLDGHGDGADQVELLYPFAAERRGEPDLEIGLHDDGLVVRVDGWTSRSPVRFVAVADGGGWMAHAWSAAGHVRLPRPPAGETVTVIADAWGSLTARRMIEVPAPPPAPEEAEGAPGTPAAPEPREADGPAPGRPAPRPDAPGVDVVGHPEARRALGGLVMGGALVGAAGLVWRRAVAARP